MDLDVAQRPGLMLDRNVDHSIGDLGEGPPPLLEPLDLIGWTVTANGLHNVRNHAFFLRQVKDAYFVFPVLENQPILFIQLDNLDWRRVLVTVRGEE